MHQIRFRLGLRPRPHWPCLQRSPRPHNWIWGDPLLRGGKGRKGKGKEGKNRYKGEGKGKKGKGKGEREDGIGKRRCAVGIFNYFRLCIRHVLRDRLHWLPVQQRVQLCLLTFKALHGLAPTYLADLCQPVGSVGSRQRLRSATRGDLVISPTITHFGARSFAVAGPKRQAWNHLPADIHAIDSVNSFKSAIKTFLFRWLFV